MSSKAYLDVQMNLTELIAELKPSDSMQRQCYSSKVLKRKKERKRHLE